MGRRIDRQDYGTAAQYGVLGSFRTATNTMVRVSIIVTKPVVHGTLSAIVFLFNERRFTAICY